MPEETEETQELQETTNGVSTPEDLEAIKAQLEEEKEAKAAVEASLAEKDARIVELEGQLSEAQVNLVSVTDQLTDETKAHAQAISKYLDAVRLANSTIPQDIIAGDTIEDIDASLAKAQTIAGAVKANLEARDKEAKVPAGAPTRGEISLEGLTPREKIAAGIQQGSQG